MFVQSAYCRQVRFGEFLGYPHHGLGFQSGQVGQYLPQMLVVRPYWFSMRTRWPLSRLVAVISAE